MLDAALFARPALVPPPLPASRYGSDRRTHLVRNEQAAFASVLRAYAGLADTPLDSSRLKAARRAVHDSKEWWTRALADLDRSQGWE